MAITKTDAVVENVRVQGDIITAQVKYTLSDSGTDPATEVTKVRVDVTVANATSAELTAMQSVVSKAAVLAVA